jgi:ribonucleoside-diphosphate reductase alpha chain
MLETSQSKLELSRRQAVLPETPPLPANRTSIELGENAKQVLAKRYLRKGADGNPNESVDGLFWRVAYNIALAETEFGNDPTEIAELFYELLTTRRFFPNSPTFTGAGTPLGQLAACFVLPISDDMGRDSAGIFQTLRDAALIQQTGGGNGFSFSRLRHKGALVKSSAGRATGPVGFLRVYDRSFGEVAQGGTRRGANMAVLRVDHPDIRDFITCKVDENAITNFNISVAITDDFMRAVKADQEYNLIAPHTGQVVERVRAREVFELIVTNAHHNGEPGMLFLDAANRDNPVPHLYELEATNPCGEQWLGPYENCCLGSINLAEHVTQDQRVDWEKLKQSVSLSTRFLDDVVSANKYVPAVPQLREAAMQNRRIGLGIMGLADMMYQLGIRYGSEDAQEFAGQVMEFIRYQTIKTSIELAAQRGPFSAIEGSVYDPENTQWTGPEPIRPYRRDYGRPEIDWSEIIRGIQRYGLRNAAQTTVAPTGTIATVAGCEGYGCEPVFALAYIRHVNDNGQDLQLQYLSPLFEEALAKAGIEEDEKEKIIQQILDKGSCQGIPLVPEEIRNVFVVSQDITAEEHVRMQAALQRFVDSSLSKTCNFPEGSTEQEVAEAYQLAWELGCKGLTVYVTGSRHKVVLETRATKAKMRAALPAKDVIHGDSTLSTEIDGQQMEMWMQGKKPRPKRLDGHTFQVGTPVGKAFITINENGGHQPFEVFITTAKAGSETAAVSEALGRLVSYVLRLSSPVTPRDRMAEIVRQLAGIGGGRPTGFGPNRVLSLPDGVAQAMSQYLGQTPEPSPGESINFDSNNKPIGDLCPECGAAALVNEEGCRKCYTCRYSEC